jgi:hypothetical protein
MANPLDRTWYNTLVDDDGSGTTGTPWNKAAVNSLLASVDASLAALVDKGGAAGVLNELPVFADADTIKGGSGILAPGNATLMTKTSAGADNLALYLSGASEINGARGAFLYVGGNQFAAPGFINLNMGNAAGSAISFAKGTGVPVMQWTNTGIVVLNDGQLQFPVTQKPSADPYTIDDYREGLWAPTITATGGASGQTYVAQRGTYVKWGRHVFLNFEVALSGMGTASGNVLLGNLPFPPSADTYLVQTNAIGWYGLTTAIVACHAQLATGSPLVNIYCTTGPSGSSFTALPATMLTATTQFQGSLFYRCAQ